MPLEQTNLQPLVTGAAILISSLVGFVGVCATLWWNARLERIRQQENRQSEINSLRSGFIAELRAFRAAFENHEGHLGRIMPDAFVFVRFPIDDVTRVYSENVGRIGMLPANEAQAIIKAYANLRSVIDDYHAMAIRLDGNFMEKFVIEVPPSKIDDHEYWQLDSYEAQSTLNDVLSVLGAEPKKDPTAFYTE